MQPNKTQGKVFLLIARHGQAQETSFSIGPTLNDRGKIEAKLLGENLKNDELNIKNIHHSGITRSTQTAEIILGELQTPKLDLNKHLAESFDKNTGYWLTLIESLTETTLLVGHFPTIEFVLNLANPNLSFEFTTGSCIGLLKNQENLTYSEAWSYKIPK
jgi:phosphohistidine phosphatase SixA